MVFVVNPSPERDYLEEYNKYILDRYGKVKYWFCKSHRSKVLFIENIKPTCSSEQKGGILLPCAWELRFE